MSELMIVCGSGRTLFDDLKKARSLVARFPVMAINGAVYGLEEFEHLASLHSDMVHHWRYARGVRQDCGVRKPARACQTHSDREDVDVDVAHAAFPLSGGSSALFGVQVALFALNAKDVLLCGVPYDDAGHFYDPPLVRSSRSAPGDWEPWMLAKGLFGDRVRSMSGKTKELFGDG